jgi:hypothetical protein
MRRAESLDRVRDGPSNGSGRCGRRQSGLNGSRAQERFGFTFRHSASCDEPTDRECSSVNLPLERCEWRTKNGMAGMEQGAASAVPRNGVRFRSRAYRFRPERQHIVEHGRRDQLDQIVTHPGDFPAYLGQGEELTPCVSHLIDPCVDRDDGSIDVMREPVSEESRLASVGREKRLFHAPTRTKARLGRVAAT